MCAATTQDYKGGSQPKELNQSVANECKGTYFKELSSLVDISIHS